MNRSAISITWLGSTVVEVGVSVKNKPVETGIAGIGNRPATQLFVYFGNDCEGRGLHSPTTSSGSSIVGRVRCRDLETDLDGVVGNERTFRPAGLLEVDDIVLGEHL